MNASSPGRTTCRVGFSCIRGGAAIKSCTILTSNMYAIHLVWNLNLYENQKQTDTGLTIFSHGGGKLQQVSSVSTTEAKYEICVATTIFYFTKELPYQTFYIF
jgi:hypothetical protein